MVLSQFLVTDKTAAVCGTAKQSKAVGWVPHSSFYLSAKQTVR